MPLIKDGIEVEDSWTAPAPGGDIPEKGDLILSLEELVEAEDKLKGRNGRLGVRLPNSANIQELKDVLANVELVILEFPAFADGRAYSQAWQLRNELGFKGEIRATGNVLADQAAFMLRSGFDSFELEEGSSLETLKRALASMTHAYQRGFGEPGRGLRRPLSFSR